MLAFLTDFRGELFYKLCACDHLLPQNSRKAVLDTHQTFLLTSLLLKSLTRSYDALKLVARQKLQTLMIVGARPRPGHSPQP